MCCLAANDNKISLYCRVYFRSCGCNFRALLCVCKIELLKIVPKHSKLILLFMSHHNTFFFFKKKHHLKKDNRSIFIYFIFKIRLEKIGICL
jgi:hypothetical protein